MNIIANLRKTCTTCFLILLLLSGKTSLSAQADEFQYYYRVFFRDKGDYVPGNYIPSDLLSERAIKRREKAGIPVPDMKDIPVFTDYLEQIKSMGLTLHCTSKWMNTALFKSRESFNKTNLLNLPFVAEVKTVKRPSGKGVTVHKFDVAAGQAVVSDFDRQITMINGASVQASGFDGTGVLIAVLDAGFDKANLVSSLSALRVRKGIKSTYDFVRRNKNVYDYHYHGTAVLSVLAGQIAGLIQGTGPGADFMLLRTEDDESEFPVEEDYWAAGAEYADSAGADIISSSLGYYNFDDPEMNYTFQSMDGNTAFVTKVADIAASKGIVVVASAGNERNKPWKRIIAPSDGDSVISVGAVDAANIISSFSSAGPSADGRVKPDNATMGVNVTVQIDPYSVTKMNGTSFSCPVLSGLTACLKQAVPEAINSEIIDAIHLSADRYNSPDSLYGYGIPDMLKALTILQDIHLTRPDDPFIAGPNPTTGNIEITFREPPERLLIEIFTFSGVNIFSKEIKEYAGRKFTFDALNNMHQGLYILRLITGNGTFTRKIIKTND
jgi:hypothetical protein